MFKVKRDSDGTVFGMNVNPQSPTITTIHNGVRYWEVETQEWNEDIQEYQRDNLRVAIAPDYGGYTDATLIWETDQLTALKDETCRLLKRITEAQLELGKPYPKATALPAVKRASLDLNQQAVKIRKGYLKHLEENR